MPNDHTPSLETKPAGLPIGVSTTAGTITVYDGSTLVSKNGSPIWKRTTENVVETLTLTDTEVLAGVEAALSNPSATRAVKSALLALIARPYQTGACPPDATVSDLRSDLAAFAGGTLSFSDVAALREYERFAAAFESVTGKPANVPVFRFGGKSLHLSDVRPVQDPETGDYVKHPDYDTLTSLIKTKTGDIGRRIVTTLYGARRSTTPSDFDVSDL